MGRQWGKFDGWTCNVIDKPYKTESTPLPEHEMRAVLLASDLAREIEAEFEAKLETSRDVPQATAVVLGRFQSALTSPREGPVVLIALAVLQQREEYLQSVIKEAAVDLIESGEARAAYRPFDSTQRKGVGQVLDQFAKLLNQSRTFD
jgi:hypothetical protein